MPNDDWKDSIPFELTESDRRVLEAGDEKFMPHSCVDPVQETRSRRLTSPDGRI